MYMYYMCYFQTLDQYGGIDILVSNAAANPTMGPLIDASTYVWYCSVWQVSVTTNRCTSSTVPVFINMFWICNLIVKLQFLNLYFTLKSDLQSLFRLVPWSHCWTCWHLAIWIVGKNSARHLQMPATCTLFCFILLEKSASYYG